MGQMNLLICGALLGVGVLLSGCGAGTDATAPPANNPAGSTTNVPVTTTSAYPLPATAGPQPLPITTTAPLPATRSAYPLPSAAGEDQVITDINAGQTITLKVGQMLLVELHDRKWSTPLVDTKILAVAPLNIAVPQGATAWKYKAITAGMTNLTTQGACLPGTNGGPTCLSILQYKVMIIVTT